MGFSELDIRFGSHVRRRGQSPEATQKAIAVIGASLAEVEKQLMQCGTSKLDANTRERVTQELVRQLDGLRRAHALNAEGSCNHANKLLAEMFSNADDGFVWYWNRPFVYAHHAVEKVRNYIEENPKKVVLGCGTSVLIGVMARGELTADGIQDRLDGIKAITQPTALHNEKQPASDKEGNVDAGAIPDQEEAEPDAEVEQGQSDVDKKTAGPVAEQPLERSDPSLMGHIFSDREGHMPRTPQNEELLENLVRDPNNFVGKDGYRRDFYAKTESDGRQLWAEVRSGKIKNGGRNDSPKTFNPKTGFYSPTPPRRISKGK